MRSFGHGGFRLLSWQQLVLMALAVALVNPDWVFRFVSTRSSRLWAWVIATAYEGALLGTTIWATQRLAEACPSVRWWQPLLYVLLFALVKAAYHFWLRAKL